VMEMLTLPRWSTAHVSPQKRIPDWLSGTIWYRGDSNLCHYSDGRRVLVHYYPSTDSSYTGDLAEVDVRDDLPSPSIAEKNTSPTKPQ